MNPTRLVPGVLLVAVATLTGCPIVDDVSPRVPGPGVLDASASPGASPSAGPTGRASARPTARPSAEPGDEPSDEPTDEPTDEPADEPSDAPTDEPTTNPGGPTAGVVGDGPVTVQVIAGAACVGKDYDDPCFVDGTGSEARFDQPEDVAIAPDGTIFVADTFSHAIRMITADGKVTTVAGAGGGYAGFVDGDRATARLGFPSGLALDGAGNLVIREGGGGNNAIRVIQPGGRVTTLAGKGEDASGRTASLIPGEAAKVRLGHNEGVALVGDFAYVADAEDNRIVRYSRGGGAEVFAGGGEAGLADGQGAEARFADPAGLAVDRAGNLYVADYGNDALRKIAPDGTVTTLVGGRSSEALYHPKGVAVDGAGNVFVSDEIAVFAAGTSATFGRIQRLAPDGTLTLVYDARDPDAAGDSYDLEPSGLDVAPDGSLVFTDEEDNRIVRLVFGGG